MQKERGRGGVRHQPSEAQRYEGGVHHVAHAKKVRGAQACVQPYWEDADAVMHEAKRINVKRRQMIEERAQQIDRENMRLLGRLHAIDKTGGGVPTKPAQRRAPGSLNAGTRRKEMDRITQENLKMRRLQSVKSSMGPSNFA